MLRTEEALLAAVTAEALIVVVVVIILVISLNTIRIRDTEIFIRSIIAKFLKTTDNYNLVEDCLRSVPSGSGLLCLSIEHISMCSEHKQCNTYYITSGNNGAPSYTYTHIIACIVSFSIYLLDRPQSAKLTAILSVYLSISCLPLYFVFSAYLVTIAWIFLTVSNFIVTKLVTNIGCCFYTLLKRL